MSFDEQSPYQSPQTDYSSKMGSTGGGKAKKPTSLVAISIITLILGSFGVVAGCCGVIAPFFQEAIVDFADQAMAQGGDETEDQRKLMRAGIDASTSMRIPAAATQLLGLLVSGSMVFGGIAGLRGAASSRTILAISLLLCIPSRISDTIVSSIVTYRSQAAQAEVMEEIAKNRGAMDNSSELIGSVSIIVAGVISLAMIIVYAVLGVFVLKSKEIKAFCDAQASAATM